MLLPVRYTFSTRGSAVWSGTDAQAVQKIVNTTVVMILMIVAPFAFESELIGSRGQLATFLRHHSSDAVRPLHVAILR
jgi:hypothetical protein